MDREVSFGEMLPIAQAKSHRLAHYWQYHKGKTPWPVSFLNGDALALPLADRSLDVVATAFGFRNLANYERGLAEMLRVLKPGGVAAVLEFSQPPSAIFAALYGLYSKRILPAIGGAVSGDAGAYRYLPESVRKFPDADELARMMCQAGFEDVRFERMTGGVVALHTCSAPGGESFSRNLP